MAEINYLPEVECGVSPGILETMVTVAVPDEGGKRQFLQVRKGFITCLGGKHYLPVGIVRLDYKRKMALIELPHEADSGANRLWVPFPTFRQEREAS